MKLKIIVACLLSLTIFPTVTLSKTFKVSDVSRDCTIKAPRSWIQSTPRTGNTRISFTSPKGTPHAECSVCAIEYPQLNVLTQEVFNEGMLDPINEEEMRAQLSVSYDDVEILATGTASISGYPAQTCRAKSSCGTKHGKIWIVSIVTTTATTPGIVWSTTCGASGRTIAEARKAFSYWQMELSTFHSHLKIKD